MIWNDLMQRFRRRDLVGMDLGNASVKLLRLKRSKEGGVASVVHCDYPGLSLGADESKISSFQEFLRDHGFFGASVVCNINDASLKIRKVELPKMPDHDLQEAIRWQIRDALEGPAS